MAVNGCGEIEDFRPTSVPASYLSTKSAAMVSIESKDIKFEAGDLDQSYFVDDKDILSFLKYKDLAEGKKNVVNIEPFAINGATLFYVINYEEGWDVLSADKRIPHLVGSSGHGQLTMKDFGTNPRTAWLYTIAVDILKTRLCDTELLPEEMNGEYEFWIAITDPDSIIYSSTSTPPTPPPPGYPGHYELSDVYIANEYIYVPHLLSTAWHQDNNQFVPLSSLDNSTRCPSGCEAVAGAQVLKYLHDEIGIPQYAPTSAYCSGDENGYIMSQSGSSSLVWDYMYDDGSDIYSKILMAHVGYLANTIYGHGESGASMSNLINNVFTPYGISCDYGDFNVQAVFGEIYERNMPLLMEAQTPIFIDSYFIKYQGHCFVMDGCQFGKKTTTYRYEWVYDVTNPSTPLPSPLPERIEYVTETSGLMVAMNWGDGDMNNDEVYSPTGSWATNGYYYDTGRHMVSQFSAY